MDDIFPFPKSPMPGELRGSTVAIEMLQQVRPKVAVTLRPSYRSDVRSSPFICDNLGHSAGPSRENYLLRQWLQDVIGHYPSGLASWIERKLGLEDDSLYMAEDDESLQKLQRTRVAWIDWMIQELEK